MSNVQRRVFLVGCILLGVLCVNDYLSKHEHHSLSVLYQEQAPDTDHEVTQNPDPSSSLHLALDASPACELFVETTPVVVSPKVMKVVELMHRKGIRKKVLSVKDYNEKDIGGRQIVFVEGGNRYTVFYSPPETKIKMVGWLAFWVRKDGTHRDADMETFADMGFDGKVNQGVTGKNGSDEQEKSFWDEEPWKKGDQYRAYWQKRYDAAINATLRHLE